MNHVLDDALLHLRHRLIKALGGFTEQRTFASAKITKAEVRTKKLQAQMFVDSYMIPPTMDTDHRKAYCESDLRTMMLRELEKSGDILIECENIMGKGVCVRATLYVVEGKGASMYMHTPIFEVGGILTGICRNR